MLRHATPVRLVLLAAALAAGCDQAPTAVSPDADPAAPAQELLCEATVATGQLACGAPGRSPDGARAIILGGQGTYVQLASSGMSYDGTSEFRMDVTVQNRIVQPLGTRDGTTPDGEGVRVFFASAPTAIGGTGSVAIANATGADVFTASGQPYFQYDEVLGKGQTSQPKTWRFHVPSTVTSFQFRVYVAGAVPRPAGWVEIGPGPVDVGVGGTRTLAATVRDVLGRPVAGAVTWASSDPAVASVDAAGVVSGHAAGSVTITATSGARTGSQVVGIVAGADVTAPAVVELAISPASVNVNEGDATVEVVAKLTDAGSGVARLGAALLSPAGTSSTRYCGYPERTGGTTANGTWRCAITIPRLSAAGSWTVREVSATDLVGNERRLNTAELQAAGHAATVVVTSENADSQPPAISELSLSPASVNVSEGDATVEVVAKLTDAGSGVARLGAALLSPAGTSSTRYCGYPERTGGTTANGTWRCAITIPRLSAAGSWTVREVSATDLVGNERRLNTAELQAAGYATTVVVAN